VAVFKISSCFNLLVFSSRFFSSSIFLFNSIVSFLAFFIVSFNSLSIVKATSWAFLFDSSIFFFISSSVWRTCFSFNSFCSCMFLFIASSNLLFISRVAFFTESFSSFFLACASSCALSLSLSNCSLSFVAFSLYSLRDASKTLFISFADSCFIVSSRIF